MSAIDTIPHHTLARFAGISLYGFTHSIPNAGLVGSVRNNGWAEMSEVVIAPHTVLFGGGSGEHPSLLIHINEAIEAFVTELSFLPDTRDSDLVQELADKAVDFDHFLTLVEELDEHVTHDPQHFVQAPRNYRLDLNNWPLESWFSMKMTLEQDSRFALLLGDCTDSVDRQLLVVLGGALAYLQVCHRPGVFNVVLHPKLKGILQALGPAAIERVFPARAFAWV